MTGCRTLSAGGGDSIPAQHPLKIADSPHSAETSFAQIDLITVFESA